MTDDEGERATGGGRRKRRTAIVSTVAAGALFAAGAGLWATGSWPFKDRYCWGAWQEDSGALVLGDKVLYGQGAERTGAESAPPSPEHPRGSCTVTVHAVSEPGGEDGPIDYDEQVRVQYGPVPVGAADRREWIATRLDGSGTPLPGGLPGMVEEGHAVLVLPEECDVDGRPSAVTVRHTGTSADRENSVPMASVIGTLPQVTDLLLAVADKGMEAAGCAPDEPLRRTAELGPEPGDRLPQSEDRDVCGHRGVRLGLDPDRRYLVQPGVDRAGLQYCSLDEFWDPTVRTEWRAHFLATSLPRLAALFDGLPDGRARGLARAECDGRPTVFSLYTSPALRERAKPFADRSFTAYVRSAERHLGCPGAVPST
ncbi:hypothetical protein ABT381_31215 [Streptomyces sp. NPDC000151]|uniref:hypothetical protein n=1 Tax=Streptomyces sp. NPDC000151 TaxID=3154244 RepID=UPI00331B4048